MTEFEPQTVLLCFIQCATAAAQTNTYEKKISSRDSNPWPQSLESSTKYRRQKDGERWTSVLMHRRPSSFVRSILAKLILLSKDPPISFRDYFQKYLKTFKQSFKFLAKLGQFLF